MGALFQYKMKNPLYIWIFCVPVQLCSLLLHLSVYFSFRLSFAGKVLSQTPAHWTLWSPSTCHWNFDRSWFPLHVQETSYNQDSEQSRLWISTGVDFHCTFRKPIATQTLSSPVCETLTGIVDSHCTFRKPIETHILSSPVWNFDRNCWFPLDVQETNWNTHSEQSILWNFDRNCWFLLHVEETSCSPHSQQSRLGTLCSQNSENNDKSSITLTLFIPEALYFSSSMINIC